MAKAKKKPARKKTRKPIPGLATVSRSGEVRGFLPLEEIHFIAEYLDFDSEFLEQEMLEGNLHWIARICLAAEEIHETRQEIVQGMARAFYASAWADGVENFGGSLSGLEILNAMPQDLDPSAWEKASELANEIEELNGTSLAMILRKAQKMNHISKYADRPATAELLGHYAAMQAMSTGVGLESLADGLDDDVKLPYMEYSYHYFEKWPEEWREEEEDEG